MKTCPTCQGSYPNNFAICPQDGSALEEAGGWTEGSVIRGKYRLLCKVGQGGMGSVWKATHLAFDEVRALKVIAPELLADELFVKRFKHEAVITFKLKHPNAVRVDDIDEAEDGRPFIVMEFIEGQSLKKIIRDGGPLSAARTCTIIKQAAAALDAAHRIGMIHRDIKPDNIAVIDTPEGEMVKVLDFGIAKVKEARMGEVSGMTLTGTGVVIGTPQYMSPEQAMGKRGDELDGRADLYSLGVVMYQMLTADLPFKADTTMEMLLAHMQKPPAPIRTVHPELNVPEPVAALTMRLLEKNREMRPASARALIQEIEKVEAEIGGVAATQVVAPDEVSLGGVRTPTADDLTPTGGSIPPRRQPAPMLPVASPPPAPPVAKRQPSPPPPVVVQPMPQPPAQVPAESRWGIWVALIVLVVGLGGGGVYLFWRPALPASQDQPGIQQPPLAQPVEKTRAVQADTTTPVDKSNPTVVQPVEDTKVPVSPTRESFRPVRRTAKPSQPTTREVVREMPPTQPIPAPPDPQKIRAAITEGDVMLKDGDYDAAITAYQKGLNQDPSNVELRQKFDKAKSACESERKILNTSYKCAP